MAKVINPFKNHSLFKKAEKTLAYSKIENSIKKEAYVVKSKKLNKK